ncbi:MAG: tRNA lysidine(34) synthetase TilS [Luteibaculum sp.]
MENWFNTLRDRLDHYLNKKDKVLVAVSGGLDSVVLTDLLHFLNYPFAVAHVNFGLRGQESNQDEQFVRELAKDFGANFHLHRAQLPTGENVQQWARETRYTFFNSLCDAHGYPYVLLAQHADDQVEQFFLKSFRSQGAEGLAGMRFLEGNRLRPLLDVRKKELKQWAEEKSLQWREDKSNASIKYRRNWVRNALIPFLKQEVQDLEQRILSLQRALRSENNTTDFLLKEFLMQHGKKDQWGLLHLQLNDLNKKGCAEDFLCTWLTKEGFSRQQCLDMWAARDNSESAMFSSSVNHSEVEIRKGKLFYLPAVLPSRASEKFHSVEDLSRVYRISELPNDFKPQKLKANQFILPLHKDVFPIEVRSVRLKDRMQPFGMEGKWKSLHEIFKDAGISMLQRKFIFTWESNRGILYLEGLRSSELTRLSGDVETSYLIDIS